MVPDPIRISHEKTKKSKSSFYYSFLFMPKRKREAMFSVYAFCRETDDLVDNEPDPDKARHALDAWRREIDACFEGRPTHPIAMSLRNTLDEFPMPAEYFHGLIDGCEMDLVHTRYRTFGELYEYGYRVASLVGLICIEIFGYRSPQTKDYAVNLGMALQLTNILRDVGEDAERGRIYLPLEDLERFGCPEADLLNAVRSPAFAELMAFQAQRAESFYAKAMEHFEKRDRDLLYPAEIMRRIYHRLLERIVKADYNVFQQRVRVPNREKIRLAMQTWLASRLGRLVP